MARKKKRLPPYHPPTSFTFREVLQDERAAIAAGDTEGLDPAKEYLAVRVGRKKQMPIWIVAESPVEAERVDGVILFAAAITLGSAIYMVKQGAEVVTHE